jgi:hypothetical protein
VLRSDLNALRSDSGKICAAGRFGGTESEEVWALNSAINAVSPGPALESVLEVKIMAALNWKSVQ